MIRPIRGLVAVVLVAACDPGDGPPADLDVDLRLEIAAPLSFELHDGQRLRLHEVELADGRIGLLELDGDGVEAAHGWLRLAPSDDVASQLIIEDAAGAVHGAGSQPTDDGEHESFDAELDGLELWGFDRAVFTSERGVELLSEPVVVHAVGLTWSGAALHVRATPRVRAPTVGDATPVGGRAGSGPTRAAVEPSPTAHAALDDAPGPDGFLDADDPLLAPGDPCQGSSMCDDGTTCVADAQTSDGAFRCLAECVGPAPSTPIDPLVVSSSAVCVDDGGCCDPSLVCSNGACEARETGDDSTVTSAGGGCDPDGDDVISACDPKPNESCKADSDGDGCANSFDDDDSNACRCNARVPRPNSLAIGMLALAFMHGRRRRR